MPASHEIILDPSIRDWVLFPIFLVMFLQGVLRQYISVLLKDDKKTALDALSRTQLLRRSARTRANASYLSPQAFHMRKRYLTRSAFKDEMTSSDSAEAPPTPAQDPLAMVGMMKQNMAMIVPNMVMMGWVTYFFSGFVLVKLPFTLTDRFKSMLQRGVGLSSLDVSYVSSLSWYFLNLFGLRGLFTLVLGSDSGALDNTEVMAQQMQGGMNQAQDPNKLFESPQQPHTHTNLDHSHSCCHALTHPTPSLHIACVSRRDARCRGCRAEKNELEIVQVRRSSLTPSLAVSAVLVHRDMQWG